MSRIPPSLLYLTIYNPTLRPDIAAIHDDDEDTQEQVQILFYTSRDRAASRDKMLRQVGLAKALVNFAEIFHSTGSYQNVHSQSRRMVMVSPEPNFWIHVAIELEKTPRAPVNPKIRDKGKGKASERKESQVLQFDYHDGTLHDSAIRAHLMRGYEQFKLTHGSFSSILSLLGQQALELQLERFFIVWAWTWDLNNAFSLGIDLGLPLHPSYQSILPAIDSFTSQIPEGVAALVFTQSHVAPSSRYRSSQYPVALARHLMNHLTPMPEPTSLSTATTTQTEQPDNGDHQDHDNPQIAPNAMQTPSGAFFGVSVSMSMSMDVRRWAWPSFRKGPKSKEVATNASLDAAFNTVSGPGVQVDQSALEDAMASDNPFYLLTEKPSALDEHEKHLVKIGSDASGVGTPCPSTILPLTSDSSKASPNGSLSSVDTPVTVHCSKPQFTWIDVFLAPIQEPLATGRKRVYLLKRGQHAVALVGNDDLDDVEVWEKPTWRLLEDVEKIVSEDSHCNMVASLPSAAKILQPKDSYILKTGGYVNASEEAPLDPDHLFEVKGLLDRGPAVIEVFSRGLHPQHWHVASRVADPVEDKKGEAYLEVSRKEATLSDVDNILRGLYKTHV